MKKTFLARRNALFSSADVSWGVYALSVSIFLCFVRFLAPNFFWQAVTPVFRSADFVATKSHLFFSSFSDAAKLVIQNEKLLEENTALVNENQALRQAAADIEMLPDGGILASVVARPPESPYDTLILAMGSTAGVAIGQEAFGEGGVPVGVVSSVTADFSRVTLFSAPHTVIHGWVGQKRTLLTIFGAGAGAMNASLSHSADIMVGDTVFAPGPGMLPIGVVARVDGDPSSPVVTLRIKPNANLFSIARVRLRDVGTMMLRDAFSVTPVVP